jgi:hypothetical protein
VIGLMRDKKGIEKRCGFFILKTLDREKATK